MSLPKHTDPKEKGRIATAPYNFVPLPEALVTVDPPPDQDKYYTDEKDLYRFTGYLDCTLETVTPLYTRCLMSPDFFKKYGDKSFYDLEDEQKRGKG